MAATARGSIAAKPAALAASYSVSRGGTVGVQLAGLDAVSPASVYMGVTNPGPPATFADMTLAVGDQLAGGEWDTATQTFNEDTGAWSASLKGSLGVSLGVVGDNWWVAVFLSDAGPPSGSTVPDFVLGPFVAIP